jgi:fluoride ion exporter CrcB/FEX
MEAVCSIETTVSTYSREDQHLHRHENLTLTLEMEAVCSVETTVSTHNREYQHLHRHENLTLTLKMEAVCSVVTTVSAYNREDQYLHHHNNLESPNQRVQHNSSPSLGIGAIWSEFALLIARRSRYITLLPAMRSVTGSLY